MPWTPRHKQRRGRQGIWEANLALGENGTAPLYSPLTMKPITVPSGTAQEGDIYWDSTAHAPAIYDATAWRLLQTYFTVEDAQNQLTAAQYAVSHTIYLTPNVSQTFKIAGVSVVFGTASSSGTMQVEVATGTQALASGTNQLTGTVSLAGTANTTVNGTLIASPTTITAGSRINLIFAGTVTSLANCAVTVALQRVS